MKKGTEAVAAARALVGVRFRPQGRAPEIGLDCIGLIARALGVEVSRADYDLRGGTLQELEAGLRVAGCVPVAERRAGDVLVMHSGPGQLHLGIWAGDGIVHADARLRRVVERPGEVPWAVLGTWRLMTGGD